MKKIILTVLLLSMAILAKSQERQLVWSDEFNYEGAPDSTMWGFELGDGCPHICGWGNNELQFYTDNPENVRVTNGRLIIEAHKVEGKSYGYTSSKVVSTGKGDWQYGYIEIRAKLPYGKGTWPAIWMLPTLDRPLDWPMDGEIDIMEHVGYNQGMVYGTIHTKKYNHRIGTQKSDSIYVDDLHENFHTYAIDWGPEHISWYVDGDKYYTIENKGEGREGWPFDQQFHIIFNLAVGGDWGGKYGIDEKIWPQRLEIDYIRVHEANYATEKKPVNH
ncbi:glycoside hydrolase family 16 protein [Fulvivirga ulvae]|uniref:glycoside hydrolase family 16 protein n=1 Tax=Fulvivirga ulvae TaxID=2904245 RepID=UPI001F1D50AD|nr:glycoside hydrolase family 16 protein [Fulvivirga ulvae]UII31677.1 glycoside hydrolase family 16 protein [Fulvivirga ulvae]